MAPRHGADRNATPTGPGVELRGRSVSERIKNPQELYLTDQTAPYLAAIVIVMFLAGCVLIVVSLRDRLREATGGSDLWTQEPIGRCEVSDELSNLRINRAGYFDSRTRYFSEAAKRRSRCGFVRGMPVLSSHFSPGLAPQVEQRTIRACAFFAFIAT